jgi:hypothetical protein
MVFHRGGANIPSVTKADLLQHELIGAGLLPTSADRDLPRRLFREDLYRDALNSNPRYETVTTS